MTDNLGANERPNNKNAVGTYGDYLKRASAACEDGDSVLGMHLYLAAYEMAAADPTVPDGMAVASLREAWQLACSLKERSMAEYVFEKLEPFLTGEEIARCANELQNLALDRLEEYGFSREELQDMAEMISQDLMDGDSSIVKVESISIPRPPIDPAQDEATAWAYGQDESYIDDALEDEADEKVLEEGEPQVADVPSDERFFEPTTAAKKHGESKELGMGVAPVDGFNPYDLLNTSSVGTSYHAATNDGTGSYVFTRDKDRAAESERARAQAADDAARVADSSGDQPQPIAETASATPKAPEASEPAETAERSADLATRKSGRDEAEGGQSIPALPDTPTVGASVFNYRSLAGYDETISLMRNFGIGLQRDPAFRNFISMMNARHGLNRMPAVDTLLFRAPAIEDATRFVDATIGEIGLPMLRLSMEEGWQGAPMLCVTTQGGNRPRLNHAQNRFEGPGVLVIDDLDMWVMPQMPEAPEGIAGFMMANISRGAREAMNMVRAAIENPDVYVLATATTDGEIDPFFYDLLEPITIVDIGLPGEADRDAIWRELMHDHPSLRTLNRADLVRFSAGLARYDLYMATRAALEEAYKSGMAERMYLPVTSQNMFDKLAACQPLDSDEYRAIEDAVVRTFSDDLDDLADLLGGSQR